MLRKPNSIDSAMLVPMETLQHSRTKEGQRIALLLRRP